MKISDIIREEVDMSWWREKDESYNPESAEYAKKQEKRQNILDKNSPNSTKVFTKPVRKAQEPFSNQPKEDEPKSTGYAGNVDVRVRAGHINKKTGDDLLDQD